MRENIDEDSIKKQLGINSWRELSKSKVIELISMFEMNPNIDKETWLEILKNVPQFIESFKDAMAALKETINQSSKASEETKKYYFNLMDKLTELLSNSDTTEKDRDNIFQMLKEINEYINELDKRDRNFFDKVLKIAGALAGFALVIIGVIAGVKIKEPKN